MDATHSNGVLGGAGSVGKLAVPVMRRLGAVFAVGKEGSSRFSQSITAIAVASTTFCSAFYLFQSISIISSIHQRPLQGSQAKDGPKER